jgi:hypothetical protein
MIAKLLKLLSKRKNFSQFEEYLCSRFAAEADEESRLIILEQIGRIKNTVRSDDGRIVKIQYGSQRKDMEVQMPIKLSQNESVIGRIAFKEDDITENVAQIFQLNGLISMMEYRKSPKMLDERNDKSKIVACEAYLKSRPVVDSDSLQSSIRNLLMLGNIDISSVLPPGFADEIQGTENCFPEIPSDYFQLCTASDGFVANGWEFLGLRFRQVASGDFNKNDAIILAQNANRDCVALMKNEQESWRLFKARINIEELSFDEIELIPSIFHEALGELVRTG